MPKKPQGYILSVLTPWDENHLREWHRFASPSAMQIVRQLEGELAGRKLDEGSKEHVRNLLEGKQDWPLECLAIYAFDGDGRNSFIGTITVNVQVL